MAAPHSPESILDQLGWHYHQPGISEYKVIEELLVERTPAAFEKAQQILEKKREDHLEEPLRVITQEGPSNEWRAGLNAVREMAYDQALLWMLTGDREYAENAKSIMLRLVEVIPHWPLYDREGQVHAQNASAYLRQWDANGLWRRWHQLDLAFSLPLLRAYDLLKPILSNTEREMLETGLFDYHKELIDKYTGLAPLYHNLAGYHLIPLIQFGWGLGRPDYIHEAVVYWEEMLRYGYGADGFYREISPDYHNQISWRITGAIPNMLNGYSDPEGYVYPKTGRRFDNLDLAEENAESLNRIRQSVRVLLMPDGKYANLNDSWPKRDPRTPTPSDQPGLLGTSGVAKLGSQGMVAFLKYHGIRGHDHRDALGLIWYAGGREVFSDTGYRANNGIEFERDWSASTASHMTVAVNEKQHFSDRTGIQIPGRAGGAFTVSPWSDEPEGIYPVEPAQPAASRHANQGSLLIWNATLEGVQAMEADQENAYPGLVSLFRRTLIMVPLDKETGEGYLVDLFRVRGGTMQDYFLRGGLGDPYTFQMDREMENTEGSLYQYIQLESKGKGAVSGELNVQADYEDGLKVISRFAGGSVGEQTFEILKGSAPAIRRPGDAEILVLRHQGEETLFPWIHETTSGESRIQGVQVWQEGMQIVLAIHLGERMDVIFSGENEQSEFEFEGWKFRGRLAYGTYTGEAKEIQWQVFDGEELTYQGEAVVPLFQAYRGKLLETTSVDAGEGQDSFLIENTESTEPHRKYHVAHVDFGEGVRQSYPIRDIVSEGDRLRVILGYAPGFMVGEGYSTMTQYPSWRIQGSPTVELQ